MSFSSWDGGSYRQKIVGHDDDYGTPVAGSKTDIRGQTAGARISNEIIELCRVIFDMGVCLQDGSWGVRFGDLFEAYTKISNKLVGMLMRARRHGLVEFEGEMLFQRRDDHVVVRLVKLPLSLQAFAQQKGVHMASVE